MSLSPNTLTERATMIASNSIKVLGIQIQNLHLITLLLVASAMFLTACGGGSSSGVRATPPPVPPPATCPDGQTGTPPNCMAPPETCPDGQTGTPPNCVATGDDATGDDWIFSGTVASERAASEVIDSILDVVPTEHVIAGDQSYRTFTTTPTPCATPTTCLWSGIWGGGVSTKQDGSRVLHDPLRLSSWGYWSHPSLVSSITKIQGVFQPSEDYYYEPQKHVIGLLEHGYFGIGYFPAYVRDGFKHLSQGGGFYNASDNLTSGVSIDGATWRGDALGIRRGTDEPVYGPATLTVTGRDVRPHPQTRYEYGLALDVKWNNGDRIQISGGVWSMTDGRSRAGSLTLYEADPSPPPGDSQGHPSYSHGHIVGPMADEVFGTIVTPEYLGSYGLKRQ